MTRFFVCVCKTAVKTPGGKKLDRTGRRQSRAFPRPKVSVRGMGASESQMAQPGSRQPRRCGGDHVTVTEARSKHKHGGDDDGQVAFMSRHQKPVVTVLKREAKEKPVRSRGEESSPRADSRQEPLSCKSLCLALSAFFPLPLPL